MIENWHQNLKNKNREELITAGKELFMNQNFLSVNIKDLCEAAGVSRVTFYKHFHSIDELICEVQMELLETMTDFLESQTAGPQSGREKLMILTEAWIDYARLHPGHLKFTVLFDLHYTYESNQLLKQRYTNFINTKKEQLFLIQILEAGKLDGSIRPDIEAVETAQFIYSSMIGLLQKLSLFPIEEWGSMPTRFVDMLIQYLSNSGNVR
ncbi:TetR/AcrR family transcriptional regulator [Paenibacillus sp. MMS20-IR301]|uniref:TetR/AcrR family transcriptional regulator n=1 Tax=Paenibacillus sp. MMS20-IR301 TaxID=2895946 RepID=UPI0028E4D630|nr:TetR/AcrR family transcriptional regulator [Paenibacillus sp. MMS20-IR301]WNS43698.1 TetR/AcrR family transcriptional regulator [Paenibacillus sp. MMS20-IR301]